MAATMQMGVPITGWQKLRIFALFVMFIGMVFVSVPAYAQAVSVGDGPPKAPEEAMKELNQQIQRFYRQKAPSSNKQTPAEKQIAPQVSEEEKKSASESSEVSIIDEPHADAVAQQSAVSISKSQARRAENIPSEGIKRPLLITIGVACICGALILVSGGIWLFSNREH